MKVLITGGAGFIGSHLAEYMAHDTHVRVLDDFSTGNRDKLSKVKCEILEGSILDRDAVRVAMRGVEYVWHLAAMVSVAESVERPFECVQANVLGLINVLEEGAAAGIRKLCFSSSAAVYGNDPTLPKEESMAPQPLSPYAITKLDGELYCRMFAKMGRLPTVSLRYFNVFGPRQNLDSAYAAAVPIFIRQALAGDPITIYGDGEQTRDFIYVKDVVAANKFAMINPELTGVFNVGRGRQESITNLAHRIISAVGSRSEIRYATGRPGDVRHSYAKIAKIQSAGFRPTTNIDFGLVETINYFRERNAEIPR